MAAFEIVPGRGYEIKRASLIEPCPCCAGHPNTAVARCPQCGGPLVMLDRDHFRDLHTQSCLVLWLMRAAQLCVSAREALRWKT